MNDKQLFKMCLTYVKALTQPVTRAELIKLLEARLLQENKIMNDIPIKVTQYEAIENAIQLCEDLFYRNADGQLSGARCNKTKFYNQAVGNCIAVLKGLKND